MSEQIPKRAGRSVSVDGNALKQARLGIPLSQQDLAEVCPFVDENRPVTEQYIAAVEQGGTAARDRPYVEAVEKGLAAGYRAKGKPSAPPIRRSENKDAFNQLDSDSLIGDAAVSIVNDRRGNRYPSFSHVPADQPASSHHADSFYNGAPVGWCDLAAGHDIPRQSYGGEGGVRAYIQQVAEQSTSLAVLALLGVAGTGKTSLLRRVAFDACRDGCTVLVLNSDWMHSGEGIHS